MNQRMMIIDFYSLFNEIDDFLITKNFKVNSDISKLTQFINLKIENMKIQVD